MGPTAKFRVYENAAVTEALRQRAIRPSATTFLSVLGFFLAAASVLVRLLLRRDASVAYLASLGLPQGIASSVLRAGIWLAGFVCLAAVSAFCKVVYMWNAGYAGTHIVQSRVPFQTSSLSLTDHQQALLGMPSVADKKQVHEKVSAGAAADGIRQRPPRTRTLPASSPSASPVMVPLHPSAAKGPRSTGVGASAPWTGSYQSSAGGQVSSLSPAGISTPVTLYRSQVSPFGSSATVYASPSSMQRSPVETTSSPWARDHTLGPLKDELNNEVRLEEFLVETQNKMLESSFTAVGPAGEGYRTPPPTLQGVGPGTSSTANFAPRSSSSTPRSRPLRMSPSTHKTVASPKKGEWEFPLPMSLEQVAESLQKLGVAVQLEQWRDRLRQWFSGVLLDPLVFKIDTSHIQVVNAAAKLNVPVTVAQVGSSSQNGGRVFPSEGASREWLSTFAPDDDVILHQLRSLLVQALTPARTTSIFGLEQPPNVVNPAVRECLDAVTEHQRLKALMEGEWVKGLLPQSSWKAEYAVQRVRELAEGTCVKRYDFLGRGGVYDKDSKRLSSELPSDSHLLLYLFCALLEHPQWMLHVDPTSHPSTQCGNNPLYVATLPHKEIFPEKYVAVLSHPPQVLHMGACILAVSKQSPPVFALYWDKKLQFSLQGRTALWDGILLLCYRIKVAHGGVVRGINLGSSALNLLPLLEPSAVQDFLR